ncbi:MAG: hypothetical protein ACRDTT_31205, partial [Pseudonocardiaceae bacterium]
RPRYAFVKPEQVVGVAEALHQTAHRAIAGHRAASGSLLGGWVPRWGRWAVRGIDVILPGNEADCELDKFRQSRRLC